MNNFEIWNKSKNNCYSIYLFKTDSIVLLNNKSILIPAHSCLCKSENDSVKSNSHSHIVSFHPKFINFAFSYDNLKNIDKKFIETHFTLYRFYNFLNCKEIPYGITPLIPYLYEIVENIFDEILLYIKQKPEYWQCNTRSLLMQLLSLIEYRILETGTSQIQSKIVLYILENIYTPITGNDICQQFNIDPKSFSTNFYSLFKINFTEYISEIRMQIACYALIYSNLSLTEIAVSLGFSTPSHFSRLFKNIKKITPSQYRRFARVVNPEKFNTKLFLFNF